MVFLKPSAVPAVDQFSKGEALRSLWSRRSQTPDPELPCLHLHERANPMIVTEWNGEVLEVKGIVRTLHCLVQNGISRFGPTTRTIRIWHCCYKVIVAIGSNIGKNLDFKFLQLESFAKWNGFKVRKMIS